MRCELGEGCGERKVAAFGERETMGRIGRGTRGEADGRGNGAVGAFVAGTKQGGAVRGEEGGEERVFSGGAVQTWPCGG